MQSNDSTTKIIYKVVFMFVLIIVLFLIAIMIREQTGYEESKNQIGDEYVYKLDSIKYNIGKKDSIIKTYKNELTHEINKVDTMSNNIAILTFRKLLGSDYE